MLGVIILIGAIIGLIGIYLVKLEETKKRERTKVKLDSDEIINVGTKHLDPNTWKKRSLDYKAINDAYNKADLLYSKNDFGEAQKALIYVLSLNPDHIEANTKLGLIYLQQGFANKAETIFKHLLEIDSRNAVFYSNLALSYYNQNKLKESQEAYIKAVNLDPKKESRLISLGKVCVDLKEYKEAINAYSKAIELNPKNIELYFINTDLLIKISAFDEAIAFMESLLEFQPYNQVAKDRIREIKMLKGASPLTTIPESSSKTVKKSLY